HLTATGQESMKSGVAGGVGPPHHLACIIDGLRTAEITPEGTEIHDSGGQKSPIFKRFQPGANRLRPGSSVRSKNLRKPTGQREEGHDATPFLGRSNGSRSNVPRTVRGVLAGRLDRWHSFLERGLSPKNNPANAPLSNRPLLVYDLPNTQQGNVPV